MLSSYVGGRATWFVFLSSSCRPVAHVLQARGVTHLGAVPHNALVAVMKMKIPKLGDRKVLKKMKSQNPKNLAQLRQQHICAKATYQMRGGMKEVEFKKFVVARNEALGDRLSAVNTNITADGKVNMDNGGACGHSLT